VKDVSAASRLLTLVGIVVVAAWANSPEMKTAYPGIASSLRSNPSDNATLVMIGDHW
jgi:hypothetical protein